MNAKELKEKLYYQKKNGLLKVEDATLKAMNDYCEGYKSFLDDAKTEREAVKVAISLAHLYSFCLPLLLWWLAFSLRKKVGTVPPW